MINAWGRKGALTIVGILAVILVTLTAKWHGVEVVSATGPIAAIAFMVGAFSGANAAISWQAAKQGQNVEDPGAKL